MSEAGGRREAVLTAAVTVLGSAGARGLTHRAVDRAAGVPEGTTSNSFRTRKALVAGVLEHIAELESEPLRGLDLATVVDVDTVVRLLHERVENLLGPGRPLAVARHALFLEAAVDPTLRPELLAASAYWWELAGAVLDRVGVPDAARRGRWLLAFVDGLIIDQLARPDPAFDPRAALQAAVHAVRWDEGGSAAPGADASGSSDSGW